MITLGGPIGPLNALDGAALVAIVWNYRRLGDLNERRRLRVLMAGLAAGA